MDPSRRFPFAPPVLPDPAPLSIDSRDHESRLKAAYCCVCCIALAMACLVVSQVEGCATQPTSDPAGAAP